MHLYTGLTDQYFMCFLKQLGFRQQLEDINSVFKKGIYPSLILNS